VICEAETSNRGAIRSNSTETLPNGEEAVDDAGVLELVVYAENLRSGSFLGAAGLLHPAHRSVWPPMRLNIMAVLSSLPCMAGHLDM